MKLRGLDIEDLMLLSMFVDGKNMIDAAKVLDLKQSTISVRVKKISKILGIKLMEKKGVNRIIKKEAMKFALTAKDCLIALDNASILF
jgi:DNA-binding transcriptional LysR family regulator